MPITSAFTLLTQTVQVTKVSDVTVTSIEQDLVAGDYVREVRIAGTTTDEGTSSPQMFVLRLRAVTRDALEMTAPSSQF